MNRKDDYEFNTRTIHGGSNGKNPSNALNPPIFQTSSFVFNSIEHANKVMAFESDDYVYTRGNNPTLRLFENRMAELEEGTGAVAFASGMAAISSTMLSLLKPNDTIIVHRTLYGSSYSVVTELLPRYGIKYKIADLTHLDALENLIDESAKVIYFETPSNPDLSIIDIKEVSKIARNNDIKVVVDNTFASPYFQNPLSLGADVVVHSATKYICGHGDVVGGIAIARDMDYIQNLKFGYMCELGGSMSPFNAWLLLRGLKTLGIRMKQHEKNAIDVANFLGNHPKIDSVLYPGLKDFKGHSIAKEQMRGFGAMISFEVKGGLKAAIKFIDGLKLAQLAVSLGDCETLVQLPAAITHRGYPRKRLSEFGLTESMVRISIGLEDSKDIIEDLNQAFKTI